MSSSLDTIQVTSRMVEFIANAPGVQSPRNSQSPSLEYQQTLSHELGHQERHLAWRLEVAYAMADMDQVEDDINMVFLTRFINHQLTQPTTSQVGGVSDILAGTTHKRC